MTNVYFLDIFMFVFVLQFLFYLKDSLLGVLVSEFLGSLSLVFGYSGVLPLSSVISVFTFLVLLTCCFGGYFVYSFCPCGMVEFTFVYAVVAWLSTLLTFMSGEKFSVYVAKLGDSFLKTFSMLLVELVSEVSRPLALTVRLTVNILVGHMISMMLFSLLELYLGIFYVWVVVFAIMMECFVFFIQSYIFSRLIFLYLNE
uniref:F-ATPase protein 6 n=2 Tax=Parascaris TaxID=6254 RepID=A0A089NGX6_PARUN|nr:ATP synthase F0 subunit 6 [Parascaris univalens]YP_009445835.1 ATP synthase F0 subunit 6 [Parascaris equorum]AIM58802.1 ATP synthase F0 subunit 6 [Parascaris univalens]AIQ85134.1 ATP synthase F0 subunit 6 [Parascaris univalens]ATX68618.1 ATP synthase F0 subunit 6 [Parascaris equorum]BAV81426.1 ATP synthase F0 subunit 6 [Parascaris equorum]